MKISQQEADHLLSLNGSAVTSHLIWQWQKWELARNCSDFPVELELLLHLFLICRFFMIRLVSTQSRLLPWNWNCSQVELLFIFWSCFYFIRWKLIQTSHTMSTWEAKSLFLCYVIIYSCFNPIFPFFVWTWLHITVVISLLPLVLGIHHIFLQLCCRSNFMRWNSIHADIRPIIFTCKMVHKQVWMCHMFNLQFDFLVWLLAEDRMFLCLSAPIN